MLSVKEVLFLRWVFHRWEQDLFSLWAIFFMDDMSRAASDINEGRQCVGTLTLETLSGMLTKKNFAKKFPQPFYQLFFKSLSFLTKFFNNQSDSLK